MHAKFASTPGKDANDTGSTPLSEPSSAGRSRSSPEFHVPANGKLGFGSREGAYETAPTSKEGSRRAKLPNPAKHSGKP